MLRSTRRVHIRHWDCGDLGQVAAVVEFECGHLAVRIALEMFGLPVFATAQIDRLLRDFDALLRHEQAHDARVRSDRVVEFHGASPKLFAGGKGFEQTPGSLVKSVSLAGASFSRRRAC
jgi:hypothetical protein